MIIDATDEKVSLKTLKNRGKVHKWYLKNKARKLETKRKWRKKNWEACLAWAREYYRKNKERMKQWRERYKKLYPEKYAALLKRAREAERLRGPLYKRWMRLCRRARDMKLGYIRVYADFEAWFNATAKVCEYCGISDSEAEKLYKSPLHVDRKDSATGYVLDNICLACYRCNTVKSCFLTHAAMKKIAQEHF